MRAACGRSRAVKSMTTTGFGASSEPSGRGTSAGSVRGGRRPGIGAISTATGGRGWGLCGGALGLSPRRRLEGSGACAGVLGDTRMSDKYRTIVADPPWLVQAGPRSLHDPCERSRALTYPTMSVAEIAALPIGDLVAESA